MISTLLVAPLLVLAPLGAVVLGLAACLALGRACRPSPDGAVAQGRPADARGDVEVSRMNLWLGLLGLLAGVVGAMVSDRYGESLSVSCVALGVLLAAVISFRIGNLWNSTGELRWGLFGVALAVGGATYAWATLMSRVTF